MRIVALALGLLATAATQAPLAQPAPAPRPVISPGPQPAGAPGSFPQLIVFISVDQMRADYIDRFQHQWSAGLKRLVTEGAWFRHADYPYYSTVTCPGHASMSTGTIPSVHGLILNAWWDRAARRLVACTDDEAQHLVSYGGPVTGVGQSASRLLVTTLADELRLQRWPSPHVVSLSLKARSAINLGGHRPDAVLWQDDTSGEWVTSTAFATAPAPFFADYIRAHPVKSELGRTWDRALPTERYLYDGSAVGAQKTAFKASAFPHVLRGDGTETGGKVTDAWEASPYSDAYLAGLAGAALEGLRLGRGEGTDFLGISFSALDKVGHKFGPDSHEVQDVLIRLDREVGALLDKLDRDVGRGRYTVALTADHGVSPVPERVKAQGFDAGRVSPNAVGRAIDMVLARELGPGEYRTQALDADIYFGAGIYDRLAQNPAAMEAVLRVIRETPGVRRVYRKEAILAGDSDGDATLRAVQRGYFEGRSGDLVMTMAPYWITSTDTTTHGTSHGYDTRVPVLLFGASIRAGQYLEPAAPIDLAPTLALLSGVTLPDARGRVLTEALQTGVRR